MTRLGFVDCETTGLDADRHEVWEVGLIERSEFLYGNGTAQITDVEHRWLLPVSDLGAADPRALAIGKFHDRHPQGHHPDDSVDDVTMLGVFAAQFAKLTQGSHLVGAVISFDEERLRRLLQRNGACPEWHYHLVDVEALVAGRYGLAPPWVSDDLSLYAGIDPTLYPKHTALGDAQWARALYDHIMGRGPDLLALGRQAPVAKDHVCIANGTGVCVLCGEQTVPEAPGSGFSPEQRPSGAGW